MSILDGRLSRRSLIKRTIATAGVLAAAELYLPESQTFAEVVEETRTLWALDRTHLAERDLAARGAFLHPNIVAFNGRYVATGTIYGDRRQIGFDILTGEEIEMSGLLHVLDPHEHDLAVRESMPEVWLR